MTSFGERSHGVASKPKPGLSTLPSELRRLIVSHLAPNPTFRLGSKQHLKNANLAHSCLREWVPEYMFKDMALKHVLIGMSSHLECFAATPSNANLLKFVKHISVQVLPALRWELGSENPFAHHLDETTAQRLSSRLGVGSTVDLTDTQRQYCSDYHRAMVEPFTDNRSWYRLLRAANDSWSTVFGQFKNLEDISVGCCQISDQPFPTYTHTFVLKHGWDTLRDPLYMEDETVNMAWASSFVLKTAPPSVHRLNLSLANMDNFNSFATVNRLLSMSYRRPLQTQLSRTTSLCLTLRGIAGTHGSQDEHGDTGSAGSVRHWINALNSLRDLRHLDLRDHLETAGELRFTELENSNSQATILDWILPNLVLKQLRTLRLYRFMLDIATIQATFTGIWPSLQNLILEDVALLMRIEEGIDFEPHHIMHVRGASWLEICRALIQKQDDMCIKLIRPTSNVNDYIDYKPDSGYVKLLNELPLIDLEAKNYPTYVRDPPK